MTWTAPPPQPLVDPPLLGAERESYQGWLDAHRQTLLRKCAGLTGEQLVEASCPPSILTLLGLVRHMAEVERWWLRIVGAQQHDLPHLYWVGPDPDADLTDLADADPAADLAAYHDECRLGDLAVAEVGLDQVVPAARPGRSDRNLRWIYVHLIEEYARHNGHADLLRERIDGATGDFE
jgi:uncharacterized damage-inducible protein DinB